MSQFSSSADEVRAADAQSLEQKGRRFKKLTRVLDSTWKDLRKRRPKVVEALSQTPQGSLKKKAFRELAGVADVLAVTGLDLAEMLESKKSRAQLSKIVGKGLVTRTEELRDEVIQEGFSELQLPPRIDCADVDDDHLEYGLQGSRVFIEVNPEVMMAPGDALKGGLAHEMAHIVIDGKLTPLQVLSDDEQYDSSKSYAREREREADLAVVERGLGNYLLAFFNWLDAQGYKASAGGGLKRKELKKML